MLDDVLTLTRMLVDVPSVTGDESTVCNLVHDLLHCRGWECVRQQLASDRFNVRADRGHSRVLLTTHLDTVPPFFPFRQDRHYAYGRGVCDAKGIAAAMICAAGRLVKEGFSGVGLLFVVGEETDSAGARRASELGPPCEYFVNGEPTDNELVVAHKGIIHGRFTAFGRTAHSAYPEKGESAIDKLLDVLAMLRQLEWPTDPVLGSSLLNIGRVSGGIAPNVLADRAEAEILIRTVKRSGSYLGLLEKAACHNAALEVLKISEPQQMESIEGFPQRVVGFGTDIPALRPLGAPLLLGPGSIFDAHTAQERVSKTELSGAVEIYSQLVTTLLKKSA